MDGSDAARPVNGMERRVGVEFFGLFIFNGGDNDGHRKKMSVCVCLKLQQDGFQ